MSRITDGRDATGACPNECENGVIACWSPGGPCQLPPPCELCGICRICAELPMLGQGKLLP